jgi:tRNA 2-thiocytidine biosynthesis protein TtcA
MPSLISLEKKLLHYIAKAIADYKMITKGDRVMVCLSGGKDSFTMLKLLNHLRVKMHNRFEIFSYTLDQSQPGWNDAELRQWLEQEKINYEVETRNTYAVVKEKIPEGKTYCSLCSRLRRGNIYRYARENGFNKVALGHHREDLIETLLMSIMYSGQIRSMPAKLLTDSQDVVVIRPMAYCQEADIAQYAQHREFPIIPCNLCGSQQNLARVKVKKMLQTMTADNPKIPSNMLHALKSIAPSQLLDKRWWDFDFNVTPSTVDEV